MNTEGPFAVLWVGLGLGAFFSALVWINLLLPMFLTPLFVIPLTWVLEKFGIGVSGENAQGRKETVR